MVGGWGGRPGHGYICPPTLYHCPPPFQGEYCNAKFQNIPLEVYLYTGRDGGVYWHEGGLYRQGWGVGREGSFGRGDTGRMRWDSIQEGGGGGV